MPFIPRYFRPSQSRTRSRRLVHDRPRKGRNRDQPGSSSGQMQRWRWLLVSSLLPNFGILFYGALGYQMGGIRQAIDFGLRWATFSLLYWIPLGWILNSPGHRSLRWTQSFLVSLLGFCGSLWFVYPIVGSRFSPSSLQVWLIYFAGAIVLYLLVAIFAGVATRRGWKSNLLLGVASLAFLGGIAGPVAMILTTDKYPWPAAKAERLILTNARIVRPSAGDVVTGKNIHIENGRIAAIVDSATDTADWAKLDAAGGFVVPGLIDVHTHLDAPLRATLAPFDFGYLLEAEFSAMADHRREYLRNGVTAVRDLGGPAAHTFAWRKEVSDHRLLGPRIFAAGRLVTSPDGHPVATIWAAYPYLGRMGAILPTDAGSLRRGLENNDAEGSSDVVKIVYGTIGRAKGKLSRTLLADAIQWAREKHKTSVVHIETADDVRDAVESGADGLEHMASAGEPPPDVLEMIAKRGVYIDPTFGEYAAVLTLSRTPDTESQKLLAASLKTIRAMADSGIRLTMGTDAPLVPYGSGLLDEMAYFKRAGFSPREILAIATTNNAAYLGQDGKLGCVDVGCAADLVVLTGNPLESITAFRSVRLVLRDGIDCTVRDGINGHAVSDKR